MKFLYLSLVFLLVFSSCSRKSEQELYDEGKTAQSQKNFQIAIERYQEVVERSPSSAYAESSQYRIAVIYNNDLHENTKAIQAYQKFYAMFPASSEAPNALFLVGFLYNNELHNIDSAKIAYESFLQKYPNHSLVTSAEFELETLGKDPSQLLQSRVLSKDNAGSRESSEDTKQ